MLIISVKKSINDCIESAIKVEKEKVSRKLYEDTSNLYEDKINSVF